VELLSYEYLIPLYLFYVLTIPVLVFVLERYLITTKTKCVFTILSIIFTLIILPSWYGIIFNRIPFFIAMGLFSWVVVKNEGKIRNTAIFSIISLVLLFIGIMLAGDLSYYYGLPNIEIITMIAPFLMLAGCGVFTFFQLRGELPIDSDDKISSIMDDMNVMLDDKETQPRPEVRRTQVRVESAPFKMNQKIYGGIAGIVFSLILLGILGSLLVSTSGSLNYEAISSLIQLGITFGALPILFAGIAYLGYGIFEAKIEQVKKQAMNKFEELVERYQSLRIIMMVISVVIVIGIVIFGISMLLSGQIIMPG